MSINFQDVITEEQSEALQEMFNVEAHDRKTFLVNETEFEQKKLSKVARMTNQIAQLELNTSGEIKELSDGSKYKLEKTGWKKL